MYSATYQQPRDSYLQSSPQGPMFNGQMFKTFGAMLSLFAATAIALGIANVVMTSEAYCDTWEEMEPVYCSNSGEPYVWTWIASGVWAAAPIFIAGLFSMILSNDPARWSRMFALFIFMSGIVFSPAMIILSAIEVWRGHASKWNFYKLGDSLAEGNIMVEDSPYQAKFALPLVITILGGIMFIMTGLITLALCCCMQSLGINISQEAGAAVAPAGPGFHQIYQPTPAVTQTSEVYMPPRPQFKTQVDYQPTTGPYMATRYNSVIDQGNAGAMFGNFPSRGFNTAPVTNFCSGTPGYRC